VPNDDAEAVIDALTHEHRTIDEGVEAFLSAVRSNAGGGPSPDRSPLTRATVALRRHIYLEEELLFPPIQAAGLTMPVLVMMREHGALWRLLDQLDEAVDELLGDGSDSGGTDAATVVAHCQELLDLLEQHNLKEEPIVYPRTATDLDPSATAHLAALLRTGTTPDGWVCHAANA